MKTNPATQAPALTQTEPLPQLIAATANALPEQVDALARARAFAEPLLACETLDSGENTLVHADAVAAILRGIGGSEAMQAASYLVYACVHLNKPEEVIAKAFGDSFAALAVETTKLMRVQRQALAAEQVDDPAVQTENVRKMLLAFSRDLRVVMLRLASRLQTLRFHAASKRPVSPSLARESLQVFAPLANRLGIWQMKWELEDLSFRFLEPDTYKEVARLLDEKRGEREMYMQQLRQRLESELRSRSISATVQGRPKHIYSIVKKMRGKSLNFDQVLDLRALRVVVPTVKDCYAALSWVHEQFTPSWKSLTTTSPSPSPTVTSRCTPSCATSRAARWKSRSVPRPCTNMPSMAWPHTGPTKRQVARAMRACLPQASTTPRSPCCASCWRGSVTWQAPCPTVACLKTASTC